MAKNKLSAEAESVSGTEAVGAADPQAHKKAYRSPQLICCGSVAEITRAKGGVALDGGSKNSKV